MVIADHANGAGWTWLSVATVTAESCFCERTVRHALRTLETLGYLRADLRPGVGYTFYLSYLRPVLSVVTPAGDAGVPRQEMPGLPAGGAGVVDKPRQEMPPTPAGDAPIAKEQNVTPRSTPPTTPLRSVVAAPLLEPELPGTEIAVVESVPAVTAQTIIGEWIDNCLGGQRPPGRTVGQIAKLIGEMLAEGVDPDNIRRGTARWNSRGLHPSVLPSIVHNVIAERSIPTAAAAALAGPSADQRMTPSQKAAEWQRLGQELDRHGS